MSEDKTAEPKVINVAIAESMLQFLRYQGHDLKPIFARLPYGEEYFKGGGRWVEEWVVNEIADYIYSLYGTYEILETVGEESFRRRQFGFLSAILTILFSPERLASIIMKVINRFIDKTAVQKEIEYRDGYFKWVLARKKEYGPAPSGAQIIMGKGNVKGLIMHFGCIDVKMKLNKSFVPINKMGPIKGRVYEILAGGEVEETELETGLKKKIGSLGTDGTFFLDGTLYGSEDAEVEVTWKPLKRMERLRLFFEGVKRVREVSKEIKEKRERLRKKLVEVKELREKLKWEKNWQAALHHKLEKKVKV